jgi:hypothetical protein
MPERTSQDIAKQILDHKIDGRVPHESRSFRDALDGRVDELQGHITSHVSQSLFTVPGELPKRNMHVETSMQGLRKMIGEMDQMQGLRNLLGDIAAGKPLDGVEKTKFQLAWQQAEKLARALDDQGGQSHESAVAPEIEKQFTHMVMGGDTASEQQFDMEMAGQCRAEAQGIRDQVVPLIQELAKSLNIELKKPLRRLE